MYSNALNPTVSGSVFLCLFSLTSIGERKRGIIDTCCLPCFVLLCVACFFLCSLVFPPYRLFASIFFLFFPLFRPGNSYLFFFVSRYAAILAAFLTFLHHILESPCCFPFSFLFSYFVVV